jgi:hypothetical protein
MFYLSSVTFFFKGVIEFQDLDMKSMSKSLYSKQECEKKVKKW